MRGEAARKPSASAPRRAPRAEPPPHAIIMPPGAELLPPPAAVAIAPAFVPAPAYWAPEALFLANLQEMILNQVHYYFSTENLCKDEFLRSHMDPEGGWIPVALLASFNRLRRLTTDLGLLTETLKLSPELEVALGCVRKRHGWQQWVYNWSYSPSSQHMGGDAGMTDVSDDAADTAVETGAPPSSPGSPEPQPACTTWRDAASKPPAPQSSHSTPRTSSASTATSAPLLAAPTASTALPLAPPRPSSASKPPHEEPAARKPASLLLEDDSDLRRQASRSSEKSDGWETPSLKGKERRWRKGASKEHVGITHLSSADSSLCSGTVQLTDEQRSDETTLMAEEDWASSCTEEAPGSTHGVIHAAAGRSRAAPPAAPLRKRSSGVRRGSEPKGEKPRGRGIKELNDAPPIGLAAPSLLASVDGSLLCRTLAPRLLAAKAAAARAAAAFAAAAPPPPAPLRAHAGEAWLQACLVALALLLLAAAQLCPLPPSLGSLASSRCVELPLGLALAVKFNEVGARVLASCTPVAVRSAA
ncbi:hypothetical protein AB1Y20_012958 [Prymnesium parvum]